MKINKGDAPQFNKDELKRTLAKRNRKLVFDLHTLNKLDAGQKVVVEMINGKCTNDWSLILKLTSDDAIAGIKRETEKLNDEIDGLVEVLHDMVADIKKKQEERLASNKRLHEKIRESHKRLHEKMRESNKRLHEKMQAFIKIL